MFWPQGVRLVLSHTACQAWFQIKLMPLKYFRVLQCKFVKHKSQIEFFLKVHIQAVCKLLGFFSVAFELIKLVKNKHIINSKIIRKYNLRTLQKYQYICFVANLFFILSFYSFLFSKLQWKKTSLYKRMLTATFVVVWKSTENLFNTS